MLFRSGNCVPLGKTLVSQVTVANGMGPGDGSVLTGRLWANQSGVLMSSSVIGDDDPPSLIGVDNK